MMTFHETVLARLSLGLLIMDARVIGERSDAVLRTAMPAHDVER